MVAVASRRNAEPGRLDGRWQISQGIPEIPRGAAVGVGVEDVVDLVARAVLPLIRILILCSSVILEIRIERGVTAGASVGDSRVIWQLNYVLFRFH